MKPRTIKVGASFSGKVSTGSFENMNPGFYAEEVFEVSGYEENVDQIITARAKELHEVIYKQFQEVAHKATVERIEKEFKDIRFYVAPNGKKYPSVTSILGFDYAGFKCSDEDLHQYASQGNINHARVAHYIQTGVWAKPMDLEVCWSDILALKKGPLNLNPDACDFPAFLEKYPITNMKNGEAVFNDEYEYAGTPDFDGIPDFKGAEKIRTLFDVKRTVDKPKNFMQMAAYAKCMGLTQLGIIPLNDDTDQKFSKPVMTKDVDAYFEMFVQKRKKFRERYGV